MRRTLNLLRNSPVTGMMLFVCPLLWVFDLAVSEQLRIPFEEASTLLGAASEFTLWQGDWWRVVTTAFHHGGLIHLLCNLSMTGVVGRLLEFRMGSFQYALFCLAAICVSGVVQSFWVPYVGLSGMGFAQFGLIWVWRSRDKWWQDQISDQLIQWGFLFFFGCFVVSYLGLLPIGNLAHTAGLIYGCLIGLTRFSHSKARLWWPLVLSSHIFLMPSFFFVTHPVWNGKYHWRMGDLALNTTDQIRHYKDALAQDPDLDGPWINLASIYAREQEFFEAWRYIIQGLSRHPTSEKMMRIAEEVGRNLAGPQNRMLAREFLETTFGEFAPVWEAKLLAEIPLEDLPPLNVIPAAKPKAAQPAIDGEIEEPELPELPRTLPRRALDEIPFPGRKLPAPDPDAPGSAEEGRSA